jgi:hypothetical protein
MGARAAEGFLDQEAARLGSRCLLRIGWMQSGAARRFYLDILICSQARLVVAIRLFALLDWTREPIS